MAIEFRCTQCGSLLRTPDETAGKMAKCPSCGLVLPIPTAATTASPPVQPTAGNPFAAPGPAPSFPSQTDNPYQSPAAAPAGGRFDYSAGPLPIHPSPLDVGEVMRRSWVIFKDNAGMCVVGVIVMYVVQYSVQMVANIVLIPLNIAIPNNQALLITAQVVSGIIVQVFVCWLMLGQFRFFLRIARGGEPQIGDIFSGSSGYLSNLGAMMIYGLVVMGLLLVCVGPALAIGIATGDETVGFVVGGIGGLVAFVILTVLGLIYGQFMLAIADRSAGAMESFRISAAITAGNRMSIFVLFILLFLVSIAGFLACCVGLLVTVPFSWLCLTVAYLMMSGQPTAGGPPATV